MAERPRELDQQFQMGGQFEAIVIEELLFTPLRHDAIYAYHHMVNKPFLLLGLAAEYRSRRRRR